MSSPGHLRSFDYIGLHRYSLTFCTDRSRDLFTTEDVVTLVLSQISRAAEEERFLIIAYCFMPDHLHLLVEGDDDSSNCRQFIARAKQYAGFHYARTFGGRLWQRYGFEHILRDDEMTKVVARYILENPVRAGLVNTVEAYAYVGSNVYSLEDLIEGVSRSG